MATVYISPTGAGTGDGSSIENAATLYDMAAMISAAGPSGEVLMIADQGAYALTGSAIVIGTGGTDGHPVTIRGVASDGSAMRAEIAGTRSSPFDPAGFYGEQVFRLVNGADNLSFSDMSFMDIGYGAFRVGGDIRNLAIESMDATNVQRFFEDYVTGSNATATISSLTIRDIDVNGYSRGVIRLGYDTHDVLIEDVHGDSERQDESGSTFAIGMHVEGTAHDIVIRNSSMRNAEDRLSGSFWNGDGFATEYGAYNISFENTISSGNVDAGYDIKSSTTVMNNAVAEDNGRNFRIWAKDMVLDDITSVDPNLRGGNSSENHIWFNRGGQATIIDAVLTGGPNETTTAISLTEGSAKATFTNLVAMISPTSPLFKTLSGSTYAVDGATGTGALANTNRGLSTVSGVSFTDSIKGVAAFADSDADHVIIGSQHDDVIRGGKGNDILSGGAGHDRLIGGDGNDVLIGGAGSDVLLGGDGYDVVDYSAETSGVIVDLTGSASGGAATGDLLDGIEGLIGSAYEDVLTGDKVDNVLVGGDGNDRVDGAGGNDVLIGGHGADILIGGAGTDTADYSLSSDAVIVDLTRGIGLAGDAAGDVLTGIEILVGSAHDDVLTGGPDGTRFVGGAGADSLIGSAGFDVADYSSNTVEIVIDMASGSSSGGDADGDRLFVIDGIVGTAFADAITGDERANTLLGGAGNDVLNGGGGDDTLVGGAGADVLNGGEGSDTVDYSTNLVGVAVDLAAGVATGGDADGDRITAVENVFGTAFADRLTGDAGANVLIGGNGDDFLIGGAGADRLVGGLGIDTADYRDAGAGIVLDLANGRTCGDASGDVLEGVEIVVGSTFADTLMAGGTVHTLYGNAGDDTLIGSDGDDTLVGGADADVLDGRGGFDTADYSGADAGIGVNLLTGTGFAGEALGDTLTGIERLVGTRFADILVGAGNGSVLVGGGGADMLAGGLLDVADYSGSAAAVTVALSAGTGLGGDAEGDVLIGIGSLVGSAFADSLTGDDRDNVLAGGLGADVLMGGGGIDTADYRTSLVGVTVSLATGTSSDGDTLSDIENLVGSAFNDALTGDGGANRLVGGLGNDVLDGGAGADVMIGGLGNDTYNVDSLDDVVIEDVDGGTDRINISLATYTLGDNFESLAYTGTGSFVGYGNALGNTFYGSTGSEIFYGSEGDDKFQGSLGADTFYGGTGRNSADYSKSKVAITVNLVSNVNVGGDADGDLLYDVTLVSGSDYADTMTGSLSDDLLYGRNGSDVIYGMDGNDRMDGGAGIDTLYGGKGDDYYVVDNALDRTIENFDAGYDTVATSLAAWTLADNLEALTTSTFLSFTGTGNALANTLRGNTNADILYGLAGDDTLIGLAGADRLYGGSGSDTASYADSGIGVRVNLLTNGNHGGDAEGDILLSIENVIGSAYADTLTGDDGPNHLFGLGGVDVLDGGKGADWLDGGSGADIMRGGEGDDTYVVDNVADVVVEEIGSGADTIRTSLSTYTLGATIENLMGTGTLSFTGTGNDGANTLVGTAQDDVLFGLGGADVLEGGAGADRLAGGEGSDTASYRTSATGVTVNLATGVAWGGDATGDTFESIENLAGSAYADQLTGNDEANVLNGLAGNDRLVGGGGVDILIGGVGDDVLDGGAGLDVVQLSGGRADYAFAYENGVLTVRDLRDGSPDGADVLASIEAIQFLGGYGKPLGLTEGTANNDTFAGTSAADTYFFDTSLGLATGADQIKNFNAGDRIVTTSALSSLKANSSDRFALSGTNGDTVTDSTGTLKVYSTNGKAVTSLKTVGSETHAGVTYFVYAAASDTGASPALTFDDALPPEVSIAAGAGTASDARSVALTLTFSKAPLGLAVDDLTATHGRVMGLQVTSNPLVYTAVYTAEDGFDGQDLIAIAANRFTDANDLGNLASAPVAVAIDTVNPSLVITSTRDHLDAGSSATLTLTFSEAPADFTRSSIAVDSGTLGNLMATGDSKVFTILYTAAANTDDAAMQIRVADGIYHDVAGNAGLAAGLDLSVSTPVVTLTTTYTGTSGADTFHATSNENWIIKGGTGNDRLQGAGGNDIMDGEAGFDTLVLSGSRGDYTFSHSQGGIVVHDLRAGAPDGTDSAFNFEAFTFLGSTSRPSGTTESTSANETLMGTGAQDVFLFDTALGLSLGSDGVRNFAVDDFLVTTSKIFDDNSDGRVKANSSDRFVLPSTSDALTTDTAGTVKLLNENGRVISSVYLVDDQEHSGVHYYIYQTAPTTTPDSNPLHFYDLGV